MLTQAKVHMPLKRPPLVERTGLLAELTTDRNVPVVLISAPPGYGKTTLLSQWAEHDERPFAYVHLDEHDNDPVVMLAYIALALDRVGQVDDQVKVALREPEPPLGRAVLPGIVNDMEAREPFVLALDNVHEISHETCLRILAYLCDNTPPGSQIALACRVDPLIPLASFRVGRKLLEVRAEQLLLTVPEAAALLGALDVQLGPSEVAQLVEQTEGWPAGLYLAALYLRDCDEPAAYIKRFRGDHCNVADYFVTEVLARQPDDVVEFLRRTSILDRLSRSICDWVLERRDSGDILARMERTIPFLVPIDERREWYRYHNLFGELLLNELHARELEIVPCLHHRAAGWYESQDFVDPVGDDLVFGEGAERVTPRYLAAALRHLLASGDLRHAGDVLARRWRPLAAAGRIASLQRMLEDFTPEQVASNPSLALAGAWIAYLSSDGKAAVRLLEHTGAIEWDEDAGWEELRSQLALLRAGLGPGGVPQMRADAETAYALESVRPSSWFSLSLMSLGVVRLLEGDFDSAVEMLHDAAGIDQQYGDVKMLSTSVLALCELDAGDWDTARRNACEAYDHACARSLIGYFPSTLAQAVHARVLAHDGSHAHARQIVRNVLRLATGDSPQWWHAAHALLVTVDTQLAIGDTSEAEQTLKTAAALVHSRQVVGTLSARLSAAQSAVGLRLLPEPLSASELRVFEQLPGTRSLSEIAESIYLSRNTVKSHVRAIYRKLGVAGREEAVELGRNLGLIH